MKLSTFFKGQAAEHLVISRCLLEGLECHVPVGENGRVDLLVGRRLLRCQIKSIERTKTYNGLSIRKRGGNGCKNYIYTAIDVDFMIGADMQTMDIFVVPIKDMAEYSALISLKEMNLRGYRNNMSGLKD